MTEEKSKLQRNTKKNKQNDTGEVRYNNASGSPLNPRFGNGSDMTIPADFSNPMFDATSSQEGGYGSFSAALSGTNITQNNVRKNALSNQRWLVTQLWQSNLGGAQNIITMLVRDALKGKIKPISKELSPEDIQELQTKFYRRGYMQSITDAKIWSLVYGGGGLLVCTENKPLYEPIKPSDIQEGESVYFKAYDLWYFNRELGTSYQENIDKRELKVNEKGVVTDKAAEYKPYLNPYERSVFSFYGKVLGKGRVILTRGVNAPQLLHDTLLRGWDQSYLEIILRAINSVISFEDLMLQLLRRNNIDTLKFDNLSSQLGSSGSELRLRQVVNMFKTLSGSFGVNVMDSKHSIERQQISMSGFKEIFEIYQKSLCLATGIPLVKLFGEGAGGFSSGEEDMKSYYLKLEGLIREPLRNVILQVLRYACASIFGYVPEDLDFEFEPLEVLNEKTKNEINTAKIASISQLVMSGIVESQAALDFINTNNLLDGKIEGKAIDIRDLNKKQDDKDSQTSNSKKEVGRQNSDNIKSILSRILRKSGDSRKYKA